MDYSLLGSSVHGIFQARVLERIAISFSRGSSWPRDWTQVSRIAGRRFTVRATRESGTCIRTGLNFIVVVWPILWHHYWLNFDSTYLTFFYSVFCIMEKLVGAVEECNSYRNKWMQICNKTDTEWHEFFLQYPSELVELIRIYIQGSNWNRFRRVDKIFRQRSYLIDSIASGKNSANKYMSCHWWEISLKS